MRRKKYAVFIIIILAISLFGCTDDDNVRKNAASLSADVTVDDDKNYEIEYNYGDSDVKSGQMGDIYTTYYCIEIFKLLGCPLTDDEVTDCLKYYEENKDHYFFDKNRNDNLLNIYYFTKIMSETGYNTVIRKELYDYICGLQYKEGDFGLSEKDVNAGLSRERHPEQNPFSTQMAVEAIISLDENIPNINSINEWLKLRFDNFSNEIGNRSKANIMVLREIAELIGYDCSGYSGLINSIKKQYVDDLEKDRDMNISDLYTILYDFNYRNIVDDSEIKSKLNKYIEVLTYSQLETNKTFSNGMDVLSYYCLLKVLSSTDIELPEETKENIINGIMELRVKNGGFVTIKRQG